jgi:hypothetical protein
MDMNWLTPLAQARPAGQKGYGSYAIAPIPKGTTVAAFGGFAAPRAVLETFDDDRQARSIQIDEDLYLVSAEQPEPGDMLNHSCAPSCGLMGAAILVTMHDVEIGDELTFDYAMCDGSDYDEFVCRCGAETCRGVVTGRDWLREDLQRAYDGWFSPYLARRIAAARFAEAGIPADL